MAGKYAHIIDKLPRTFGLEPRYQERVDAVKTRILEAGNPEDISTELNAHLDRSARELIQLSETLLRSVGGRRHAIVLARFYGQLRRFKKMLKDVESNINVMIEAGEQLVVDQFEQEGVKNLKLESGGSVRFHFEPYVSVMDRYACQQWCIQNGHGEELQLLWATLNALTKERLEVGLTAPDGTIVHAKPKIFYSKDKEE